MEVKLGVFVVPDATDGASTVEQIIEADRVPDVLNLPSRSPARLL